MKILVIGKNNIMSWPQKISAAFKTMGHQSDLFLFNKQTLIYCILRFIGKKKRIQYLAKSFERRIKNNKPDLIVFVSFAFIPLEFYNIAAKFNIPAVAWAADKFLANEKARAVHLNALFCTDTGFLDDAKDFNCPAYYLPLCAEDKLSTFDKGTALPPFFVGVANEKRIAYFKQCQTPCLIYGVGWPKSELSQHEIHNHKISTKKAAQMMLHSVAPINMAFSSNNKNGLNFRPFEVGVLGKLIMDCGAKDFPLCYEIGKEAVSYTTKEEFSALLADILKNPKKYVKIAHAGHIRTMRDHTYKARLTQMLNYIKK